MKPLVEPQRGVNKRLIILLTMQNKHRYLSVSLVALFIEVTGTGCPRIIKKKRNMERANRYFQTEQYEKAEIEYLNVLRLNPQNSVAISRLGSICFEQGRPGSAFSLLRKAEQLQPDNLDVRLKLGLTCLNLAGFKQARDEAIYILERQPTNDEALLLLAETSLTPKDMDDMRQRMQKLASQIEKRAAFQLALGMLHLR